MAYGLESIEIAVFCIYISAISLFFVYTLNTADKASKERVVLQLMLRFTYLSDVDLWMWIGIGRVSKQMIIYPRSTFTHDFRYFRWKTRVK